MKKHLKCHVCKYFYSNYDYFENDEKKFCPSCIKNSKMILCVAESLSMQRVGVGQASSKFWSDGLNNFVMQTLKL